MLKKQQIMQNYRQGLAQAQVLLKEKRYPDCDKLLEGLLHVFPGEMNGLHLRAIVLKEMGAFSDVLSLFDAALKAASAGKMTLQQAQILNNKANLHHKMGATIQAIATYRQALAQKSDFNEARFGLSLCLLEAKKGVEAETLLLSMVRTAPYHLRYVNVLAGYYRDEERLDEAEELLMTALRLCGQHEYKFSPDVWMRSYLHLAFIAKTHGDLKAGEKYLALAEKYQPEAPLIAYSYGEFFQEMGRLKEALKSYWQAIEKKPDYIEAHAAYAHLSYLCADDQNRKDSYRWALDKLDGKHPSRSALLEAYALHLEACGDRPQALVYLNALAEETNSLTAKIQVALIAEKEKDHKRAVVTTQKAIADLAQRGLEPEAKVQILLARFLIQAGQPEEALAVLTVAEQKAPYDQLLWGLRGICWRLLDDKRYDWLNDYHKFVADYKIDAPKGYKDLPAYLEELADVLRRRHITKLAPLDQTLRGGTQTLGNLFKHKEPVLELLKEQFTICVGDYISNLPTEKAHPFLGRRSPDGFRFSGAWSVRLQGGGYHVSHVHTNGWISSAFYVLLPAQIDQAQNHEGYIQFGHSGLDIDEDYDTVKRYIKPEPGLIALFPSYTWHGTKAFTGQDERLTAPFDIMPITRG